MEEILSGFESHREMRSMLEAYVNRRIDELQIAFKDKFQCWPFLKSKKEDLGRRPSANVKLTILHIQGQILKSISFR